MISLAHELFMSEYYTLTLIGFTNISDVNSQLAAFEKSPEGEIAEQSLADHNVGSHGL